MTFAANWALPSWLRPLLVFMTAGVVEPVPTDVELVRRAQVKGQPGRAAFDVLVERYHRQIYRQLYRLTRRAGVADDVTQDTFVKAYLELPKLQDPATFPGWLKRIATRLAFNARRDARTRGDYEERAEHAKADLGGRPADPETYTGASELVWTSLGRLSYAYREILVLRYLEELTIDEISAQLDLGKSAAKMRLKRARDEFKTVAGQLGS